MDKLKLFRYSGAKSIFIDDINYLLNREKASTYVEAFLGSGAIYLNLNNDNFENFYINDISREIVHIFKTFKDITFKFYKTHFNYVMERFGDIEASKESYMTFRNWFNKNVWKSDTKAEGIFLMILASACINSFFTMSRNGFIASWGNRNFGKNYDEYAHNHIRKRLNKNTIITNYDFFDFAEFFKDEKKDDVLMFLDPPYIKSGDMPYDKFFKKDKYAKFINYIKESPYKIVYTDAKHNDIDWDYKILRKNMVDTGPTTNKQENNNMEVAYYNY